MTKEDLINTNKYQRASLLLLKESLDFKEKFKNFAPEISIDIENASVNENCSCEIEVISFIDKNTNKYVDFLYDYIVSNEIFSKFMQILDSVVVYNDYTGKVLKTSISDWKNFQESLIKDNASFNGFSVAKDKDDIFVFFL
jgi:hypothetical protein